MNAGDWRTADAACRCLTAQHPSFAAGWVAASQIGTALRAPAAALEAIDRAISVEPANVKYLMRRAQCQLALNQRRAALDTADAVERCDTNDPVVWDAIGTLRSYANDQQRALLAYDRAITLAPQASHFIYNRAVVRRFLGDLEGAEADYDRVIAVRPLDYEAYLNRSELRVQTAARNHVRELQALAAGHIANWLGEVQIRFAFAKEYEDLGEYAQSFEQLRIGSQKRREHMKYDVGVDVVGVEPDGHRLWAGPHRIIVGHARNPRRHREPNGYRGGLPGGVRRAGQFCRVG